MSTATTDRSQERVAPPNGTAKLQMKVGSMHCSLYTESIHKAIDRVDEVRERIEHLGYGVER